jgi:NAD(P)-dependent dehydrogenase (short-subunit alcohol dehydrogenase family)
MKAAVYGGTDDIRIEELRSDALAVTCDLSESTDVQTTIDAAIDGFGRLDFACNNAGVDNRAGNSRNWTRQSGIAWSTPTCAASSCR